MRNSAPENSFTQIISFEREVSGVITIISMLKIWKNLFSAEMEASREFSRIFLINKQHYHPQLKQFDLIKLAS